MKAVTFLLVSFLVMQNSIAQYIENPGEYMTAVSNAHTEMNQRYMAYISASSHGKRAKKVDKLRVAALESITKSKYKTIELPYFKGDNTLRQSSIDYIQMCYNVFNDDYAKIVNMEEIAEQSFDDMQAYILLKEKVNEKLHQAGDKMDSASKLFAQKYNVKLVESTDALGEKMKVSGLISKYYNKIFLVFFKCNWQASALSKAINEKKINDAEQTRSSLLKYADEGIATLKSMEDFQGDASLVASCRQLLQFYKKSAEGDIPKILEFFLNEEAFNKLKKAIDAKSQSERTKEDIDAFNKSVKEINAAVGAFNQQNTNYVNTHNKNLQDWENAVKAFYDRHMPYYK